MKKLNKKGFTIVELVIVIAIIAILAAVMIPTFSGVIGDAKDFAFRQGARNAYVEYVTDHADAAAADFIYSDGGKYAAINDGQFVMDGNEIKIFTAETDALAAVATIDANTQEYVKTDTGNTGLKIVTTRALAND